MSAEHQPVRVVFRGYRLDGRKQTVEDGSIPSVNDIGASGRMAGTFNPTYTRTKELFTPLLLALLVEEPGREFEFIKPGTATTKVIIPVERDGELPHPMGSVLVEGTCYWPDKVLRDQFNYATILWKFLGDALVAGGWLAHDDWTRYLCGNLERKLDRSQPPYTELVFFPGDQRRELIDVAETAGLF